MNKRFSYKNTMLAVSLMAFTVTAFFFVLLTDTGGATLSFWLFVCLYLTVAAAFIWRYKRSEELDLFSPAPGLVLLLFLYSIASALYVEDTGTTNFGDIVTTSALKTYYVSCILGLAGIAVGMLLAQRCKNYFDEWPIIRRFKIDNHSFFMKLILYGIATAIIFSPFIYSHFNFTEVHSYGERALTIRLDRREFLASGLFYFFFTILPTTLILCMATLLMGRSKMIWAKYVGAGIFGAYILTNTLAGWRGIIISALTIPLVFYHYRIRHISKRAAAIIVVIIYLFMNALPVVRFTSDPREMFDAIFEETSYQGFTFAKLKSSGELLVGTNLMRLISGLEDGETHFTYGSSVITELLVFVPRAIYPNRPLPMSERFVDLFYPQIYKSGGGRGFFMLQEGFWAFGLVGVFLFLFIYGWSVQIIYQWFRRNMGYDCIALLYSGIYSSLVINAVRSGLIGSYKSALMSILPFLLLIYLPFFKKKTITRVNQENKKSLRIT